MLSEEQAVFLRHELDTAKNPLFIYDGDADGLSSFLILYKIHRKGRGHIMKASPKIDLSLVRKVQEYNPDKIFILDVPIVEQEFIDAVKKPIFWIDHHQPLQREHVHYFNPRLADKDAYVPTTFMAYQVSRQQKEMWIGVVGCLADWYFPDFIEQFKTLYPSLLSAKADLHQSVYKEPIGKLVKVFSFLLKGKHQDVVASLNILTRIESPDEILSQTTPPGKFLFKRFEKINQRYELLLQEARLAVTRSKILLFSYNDKQWSFTANLANELMALYPEKVIIICRKKSGEMKCSLRSQKSILPALEKALEGIDGHGGGHDKACGLVVKETDWEQFLDNFKKELAK